MFDPVKNAFREIPIELAKKFVESAENVKKQIEKIEGDEE